MALAPFPQHGDGFLLRDVVDADAVPLADIEFEPSIKRYLSLPEISKIDWIDQFNPDLIHGWIIATDRLDVAGLASIFRTGRNGVGEVRIVLARAAWGQGLGKRVGRLLATIGFDQKDATTLEGVVHPANVASRRILVGLGMEHVGEVVDGPTWQIGHLIYSVQRERCLEACR